MGYYPDIKRMKYAIFRDMDKPRDCHTEWTESDTERQISYDVTNIWNLKKEYKWTYLQNRSRCKK